MSEFLDQYRGSGPLRDVTVLARILVGHLATK